MVFFTVNIMYLGHSTLHYPFLFPFLIVPFLPNTCSNFENVLGFINNVLNTVTARFSMESPQITVLKGIQSSPHRLLWYTGVLPASTPVCKSSSPHSASSCLGSFHFSWRWLSYLNKDENSLSLGWEQGDNWFSANRHLVSKQLGTLPKWLALTEAPVIPSG